MKVHKEASTKAPTHLTISIGYFKTQSILIKDTQFTICVVRLLKVKANLDNVLFGFSIVNVGSSLGAEIKIF